MTTSLTKGKIPRKEVEEKSKPDEDKLVDFLLLTFRQVKTEADFSGLFLGIGLRGEGIRRE